MPRPPPRVALRILSLCYFPANGTAGSPVLNAGG